MFYIAAPEIQALIHDQTYHNFAEKMIGPDMAAGSSKGFCFNYVAVAAEHAISNKKVALKKVSNESPKVQALIHEQNEVGYVVYFL